MRHRLRLHPDGVCESVRSIDVDLVRTLTGVLGLRYLVLGDIDALALPEPRPSARSDRLWEHSCFEAFIADEEGEGYVELNVSPSTEWAGYRFRGYRARMETALLPPPRVEVSSAADRLEVRVALQLKPSPRSRRIGLSAILEEKAGGKSHWALAHPPGEPDFHHPHAFAAELPAA